MHLAKHKYKFEADVLQLYDYFLWHLFFVRAIIILTSFEIIRSVWLFNFFWMLSRVIKKITTAARAKMSSEKGQKHIYAKEHQICYYNNIFRGHLEREKIVSDVLSEHYRRRVGVYFRLKKSLQNSTEICKPTQQSLPLSSLEKVIT